MWGSVGEILYFVCMFCTCALIGAIVAFYPDGTPTTAGLAVGIVFSCIGLLCCYFAIKYGYDYYRYDLINSNDSTTPPNVTGRDIEAAISEDNGGGNGVDNDADNDVDNDADNESDNSNSISTINSISIIIKSSVEPGKKIDNTCSICEENAWQAVLGCGHLLCGQCLVNLLDSVNKSCPYDRIKIDTSRITPLYV